MPKSEQLQPTQHGVEKIQGLSVSEDGVTIHQSAGILAFRQPELKHVLLIKHRANNQWSFPKGHVEDTDTSLEETALREFEEETLIPQSEVTLLPSWVASTEFEYRRAGELQRKTVTWFCGVCNDDVVGQETTETLECKWVKMSALWGHLRRREAMDVARKASKSIQRHFGKGTQPSQPTSAGSLNPIGARETKTLKSADQAAAAAKAS